MEIYSTTLWHLQKDVELSALAQELVDMNIKAPEVSIYAYELYAFLLKPFPKQALVFTCLQCKSFENTVGKGEIAQNKQFLLFPQCFLPVRRAFCHFQQN